MKTKPRGIVAFVDLIYAGHRFWFWHIIGHNGEILANSEPYSSKAKAMQTARKIARQLGVEVR